MPPDHIRPDQPPDPWLLNTEALLRRLERFAELVMQIPAPTEAAHRASNIALTDICNLTNDLRFLFHLYCEDHRAKQRAFREAAAKQSHHRQTMPTDRQAEARPANARRKA